MDRLYKKVEDIVSECNTRTIVTIQMLAALWGELEAYHHAVVKQSTCSLFNTNCICAIEFISCMAMFNFLIYPGVSLLSHFHLKCSSLSIRIIQKMEQWHSLLLIMPSSVSLSPQPLFSLFSCFISVSSSL